MQFTIHLRESQPGGQYTASATLYYAPPLPEADSDQPDQPARQLPDPLIVDRAAVTFEI